MHVHRDIKDDFSCTVKTSTDSRTNSKSTKAYRKEPTHCRMWHRYTAKFFTLVVMSLDTLVVSGRIREVQVQSSTTLEPSLRTHLPVEVRVKREDHVSFVLYHQDPTTDTAPTSFEAHQSTAVASISGATSSFTASPTPGNPSMNNGTWSFNIESGLSKRHTLAYLKHSAASVAM
jgi:hypothetical protein